MSPAHVRSNGQLVGEMRPHALVYGYYKTSPNVNLGDHLFTHAFKHLFPEIDFQFTDHITVGMLRDISIVIIGGGSFLNQAPDISPAALEALKTKTILYISIGCETLIHPTHQQLMDQAQLIAIRSNSLDINKVSNPNTILIPDIVYALNDQTGRSPKLGQSILFLPNISVVPQWDDPYWKHVAFHRFQLEVSQTLDHLIEQGYTIHFYPSSLVNHQHDDWAAIEIINQMRHKIALDVAPCFDIASITQLFSQYDLIITQRYHGAILAEMSGVPYLCLYHHDKLRKTSFNNLGSFLSYFEVSKEKLLKEIDIQVQKTPILPLKAHIFRELVSRVHACVLPQ